MTLANKITLVRILLIPVFVGVALYYAESVAAGAPDDRLRMWATLIFGVAALSDALDGWIARRFKQESRLGMILDPVADKLLLLSAVSILSFTAWPSHLPLWFVTIVFAREILSTAGAFVINHVAGKVRIQPHITGKFSTFFGMSTIIAALLLLDVVVPWLAALAALFACVSGAVYVREAVRQIQASDHGNTST